MDLLSRFVCFKSRLARKGRGEADPAFGQKGLTQPFLAPGADAVAVRLPVPWAESSGRALHQPLSSFAFMGLMSRTQRA